MTLGRWLPIVVWVSAVGGLYEELAKLLDTQFSCLLVLDNKIFREYLLFIMDRSEGGSKTNGKYPACPLQAFNKHLTAF